MVQLCGTTGLHDLQHEASNDSSPAPSAPPNHDPNSIFTLPSWRTYAALMTTGRHRNCLEKLPSYDASTETWWTWLPHYLRSIHRWQHQESLRFERTDVREVHRNNHNHNNNNDNNDNNNNENNSARHQLPPFA
ncbi:unnamed protein product, partial [Polarella glacialis]